MLEKALPVVPSTWGDRSGWRSLMSTQGQGLGQEKMEQGLIRPDEGSATIVEGPGSGTGLGSEVGLVVVEEEDEL